MSNTNEFKLPAVDEAMSTLDGLYADVFFSKMAEYGFVPPSEEGALSMLETAAYLDMVDGGEKSASYADPFVDANSKLKEVLASQQLIDPSALYAQKAASIKQASVAFAQNPEVYKAVLAVKSATAQA